MGWGKIDATCGVDWDGDFLFKMNVMDDSTAPAFIGAPMIVTGVFDQLEGRFPHFYVLICFHHNGVIFRLFRW
jgi:hypothetical protein